MYALQVSGVEVTLDDNHCERPKSGGVSQSLPRSRRFDFKLREEDGWRLPEDSGPCPASAAEEGESQEGEVPRAGDPPAAPCPGVTPQRGCPGAPLAPEPSTRATEHSESIPDVLAGGPGEGPQQAGACGGNYSSVSPDVPPRLWGATAASHQAGMTWPEPLSSPQRTWNRSPRGLESEEGGLGRERLRTGPARFRDEPSGASGPAKRCVCRRHPARRSGAVNCGELSQVPDWTRDTSCGDTSRMFHACRRQGHEAAVKT